MTAFVLLLAVPFGVLLSDNGANAPFRADPVSEWNGTEVEFIGYVSDLDGNLLNELLGSGEIVLEKGYIYEIVLAGARGDAGDNNGDRQGGEGGSGAVVIGWVDLRDATEDLVLSYATGNSGEGGTGGAGSATSGGSGGGASVISGEGGRIYLVAGAGGGGAGGSIIGTITAAAGGNAGYGGDQDFYVNDDGKVYYGDSGGSGGAGGTAGAGGTHEGDPEGGAGGSDDGTPSGGGAGGAGYVGGSGGTAGIFGGGGGGGSSFISNEWLEDKGTPNGLNTQSDGWITVYKYCVPNDTYEVVGQVTDGVNGLEATVHYVIGDGDERSVQTDADGYFKISWILASRTLTVTGVDVENHSIADGQVLVFTKDSPNAVITMVHDTYTVSGRVTDGGNGVRSTIYYVIGDGETKSVLTDANGNFSITGLSGQTLTVTDVVAESYRYFGGQKTFDDETSGVILTVNEFFTVSGQVKDAGGNGISSTVYYIIGNGDERSVLTDTNGNFSIEAPVGQTLTITNVTADAHRLSPGQTLVFNAAAVGADIGVYEIYFVSGQVRDENGNGFEATVHYTIGGDGYTVATDSDGFYVIEVPVGRTLIVTDVTVRYYFLAEKNIEFNGQTDGADLIVVSEWFYVYGRVTDESTGQGVAGVEIVYKVDGGEDRTASTGSNGYYVILVSRLTDGLSVEIVGVNKNNYILSSDPGFLGPFDDDTDTANIRLTRTFTVSGQVADAADGKGLEATVYYRIDNGAVQSLATDGNGYFRIEVILGQRLTITDVAIQHYTLTEGQYLVFDDAYPNLIIRMTHDTYNVSGRIVDEYGNGLEARVYYVTVGGNGSVATDGNGNFTISGVLSGQTVTVVGVYEAQNYLLSLQPMQLSFDDETSDVTVLMDRTYSITVWANAGGSFTYSIDNGTPVPFEVGDDGKYVIENIRVGSKVEVVAVPNAGHSFEWEGELDGVVGTSISFDLGGNVTLSGLFTENDPGLNILVIILAIAMIVVAAALAAWLVSRRKHGAGTA